MEGKKQNAEDILVNKWSRINHELLRASKPEGSEGWSQRLHSIQAPLW